MGVQLQALLGSDIQTKMTFILGVMLAGIDGLELPWVGSLRFMAQTK